MLPIIYSFRRCPYAIRARYIIALLNISVELREVALKSKPSALLRLGGRSSVPQLIDIDGVRYSESLDIMFWALSNSIDFKASNSLWPESLMQRNKMMSWIKYNDKFFKHWLDRYKYADRFPECSEEYYRMKGEVFLKRLERRLGKSTFLFGHDCSIVDVAVFPFVRQFAAVHSRWFDSSQYKNVQRWLVGFLSSDVFKVIVMQKTTVWVEGQDMVIFPAH